MSEQGPLYSVVHASTRPLQTLPWVGGGLLDLPEELLLEIIFKLHPIDWSSFSLTCWTLYRLCNTPDALFKVYRTLRLRNADAHPYVFNDFLCKPGAPDGPQIPEFSREEKLSILKDRVTNDLSKLRSSWKVIRKEQVYDFGGLTSLVAENHQTGNHAPKYEYVASSSGSYWVVYDLARPKWQTLGGDQSPSFSPASLESPLWKVVWEWLRAKGKNIITWLEYTYSPGRPNLFLFDMHGDEGRPRLVRTFNLPQIRGVGDCREGIGSDVIYLNVTHYGSQTAIQITMPERRRAVNKILGPVKAEILSKPTDEYHNMCVWPDWNTPLLDYPFATLVPSRIQRDHVHHATCLKSGCVARDEEGHWRFVAEVPFDVESLVEQIATEVFGPAPDGEGNNMGKIDVEDLRRIGKDEERVARQLKRVAWLRSALLTILGRRDIPTSIYVAVHYPSMVPYIVLRISPALSSAYSNNLFHVLYGESPHVHPKVSHMRHCSDGHIPLMRLDSTNFPRAEADDALHAVVSKYEIPRLDDTLPISVPIVDTTGKFAAAGGFGDEAAEMPVYDYTRCNILSNFNLPYLLNQSHRPLITTTSDDPRVLRRAFVVSVYFRKGGLWLWRLNAHMIAQSLARLADANVQHLERQHENPHFPSTQPFSSSTPFPGDPLRHTNSPPSPAVDFDLGRMPRVQGRLLGHIPGVTSLWLSSDGHRIIRAFCPGTYQPNQDENFHHKFRESSAPSIVLSTNGVVWNETNIMELVKEREEAAAKLGAEARAWQEKEAKEAREQGKIPGGAHFQGPKLYELRFSPEGYERAYWQKEHDGRRKTVHVKCKVNLKR